MIIIGDRMKKYFGITTYLVVGLLIGIITVLILNGVNFSYGRILLYFLGISTLLFINAIIVDKEKGYRDNINNYMFLYIATFILLTMFVNRDTITFFSLDYLDSYAENINMMPMKTVVDILMSNSSNYFKVYSIVGNLVVLMPLTLLLVLKDEKYKRYFLQFKILFLTVLSIELLQVFLSVGSFDIDDFILNIGGAMLLLVVLNTVDIVPFVKKFFYNRFKTRKRLNYVIYGVVLTLIIISFFL